MKRRKRKETAIKMKGEEKVNERKEDRVNSQGADRSMRSKGEKLGLGPINWTPKAQWLNCYSHPLKAQIAKPNPNWAPEISKAQ
jgi:hypothetical protein